MDNRIEFTKKGGRIDIRSPYDKKFIQEVKQISGKWDAEKKVWSVPENAEERLKEILFQVYGWKEGDETQEDLIDVRIDAYDFEEGEEARIGSFRIAYRADRDTSVRLYNDFYVEKGAFRASGGSRRYPAIGADEGEVTLRGQIPMRVYRALSEEEKGKVQIICEKEEYKKKLEEEKETLEKRIREIEEELARIK